MPTTTQQVDPTETTISTTTTEPLITLTNNQGDTRANNDNDNDDINLENGKSNLLTTPDRIITLDTFDDDEDSIPSRIQKNDINFKPTNNISKKVSSASDVSSSSQVDKRGPTVNQNMTTCGSLTSFEVHKQRLHHIIELIADQDAKLSRLSTLRKLVREQAAINAELNKELKWVNDSISEKDDELKQALNRVDNLNRQLNTCKRVRVNRGRSSLSASKQQTSKQSTSNNSSSNCIERRVSFDPLSLLLDAALEGELDLVIQTSKQVPDLSASHDECVTALHNAAVAGHYDVAKYLIEAGCDINVQDSGGWTPLHCAANCNNLPIAKLLIENGALIYATTYGDNATPAMLCEREEPNYKDCLNYLSHIQNNLGIMNDGVVYALYDYEAQREDELSFSIDDELIILDRDEAQEKEWWWAQKKVQQNDDPTAIEYIKGYIPRNLIGLYRRVQAPNKRLPSSENDETTNESAPDLIDANGVDD